MRAFVQRRFGTTDLVLKGPKKRLLEAHAEQRAAFVRGVGAAAHGRTRDRVQAVSCADETHFYADVHLRDKWTLRSEPALVDSTSPRWGEKARYYSVVCLETRQVEVMELEGNSSAETSVTFLRQLRAHHPEPLIVIWDNRPAYGGDPLRTCLKTLDLQLRLIRLPVYSPDFNPDEHVWGLGPRGSNREHLLRHQGPRSRARRRVLPWCGRAD